MRKLKYNKLHNLLKNNNLIANSITESIKQLKILQPIIDQHLPEEMLGHVYLLHINGSHLVLAADSPAWKSRLRFLIPALEQQLKIHTTDKVKQISIKVIPQNRYKGKTCRVAKKRSSLSHSSQSIIKDFADSLDDSRLKTSLTRLYQRSKKQSSL